MTPTLISVSISHSTPGSVTKLLSPCGSCSLRGNSHRFGLHCRGAPWSPRALRVLATGQQHVSSAFLRSLCVPPRFKSGTASALSVLLCRLWVSMMKGKSSIVFQVELGLYGTSCSSKGPISSLCKKPGQTELRPCFHPWGLDWNTRFGEPEVSRVGDLVFPSKHSASQYTRAIMSDFEDNIHVLEVYFGQELRSLRGQTPASRSSQMPHGCSATIGSGYVRGPASFVLAVPVQMFGLPYVP